MIINITVADCRATLEGAPVIVCNNKRKYSIKFTFDSEWGADTQKTARFVWVSGGEQIVRDVNFTGDTVKVPPLSGAKEVKVGVFEGDLQTTTPARIYCEPSILCYGGGKSGTNNSGTNNSGTSNSVLLTDQETGTVYELYVAGGKLIMTAVD